MLPKIVVIALLMVELISVTQTMASEGKADTTKKNAELALWIGLADYSMTEFNGKIVGEGFSSVGNGINMGIEVSPAHISLPKIRNISVGFLPVVVVEHLWAAADRTYVPKQEWNLSVVGISFAPRLQFSQAGFLNWLDVRPIGLGYYRLGGLSAAKLTAASVSGELRLSGDALGLLTQLRLVVPGVENLTVQLGYRWLEFTDVTQESSGGWMPLIDSGTPFPESIDYSGLIVSLGIKVEL